MVTKSRDQSLYDFLQCLQKEYVSAELRSKIYPSIKDKKHYRKIMGYKREKIEDISLRNDLDTIFNNKDEASVVYKEVYAGYGAPNLVYRDDTHKREYFIKDILNYFSVNGEFKINTTQREIVVGTLIDNDLLVAKWSTADDINQIPVIIKIRGGEQKPILLNQLSRIL